MEEKENLNNDNLSSSMFGGDENAQAGSMFDETPQEEIKEEESAVDDSNVNIEDKKPVFDIDVEEEAEEENTVEAEKIPLEVIDETGEEDENDSPNDVVTVRPVKFKKFDATPPIRTVKKNLDIMQDISMHVSVELGRTKLSIKEVMDFEQGSIVELNKIAGEQVEVFVNGKLVARGEVIVIEDRFGVRITSTNIAKNVITL